MKNTTTTNTPNEILVLKSILEDDFQDCENPIDYPIWSSDLHVPGLTAQQVAGVLGSLAKKGLAGFTQDTLWITQAGWEALTPPTTTTTNTTTPTNAAITAAKQDGISFATKAELISALQADGFNLTSLNCLFFIERAAFALGVGFILTQSSSYKVTSGVLKTKSRNLAALNGHSVTIVVLATKRNGGAELMIKKI